MLIFDQLKKNDPQLRAVAVLVMAGLLVLLGGLWWVQIVSRRDYQANLETQSFRTVRIPAVRGKILDRNGVVLAENQPTYSINLYLDELSRNFDVASSTQAAKARARLKAEQLAEEKRLGRSLNKAERKKFVLPATERNQIRATTREAVVSASLAELSKTLKLPEPLSLDVTNFERHYNQQLVLPYPILNNVTPAQIARFEEQCGKLPGFDLEIQSTRVYPHQTRAAHLIGCLHQATESFEGEDAVFSYRLPDFKGMLGMEIALDQYLRGKAGTKSVLVNSFGYRQTENVWSVAEPGMNAVLTIDLGLQAEVERSIPAFGPFGANTHGAAVVMDVNSGDILAMASVPTYNPNHFIQGLPPGEMARLNDPSLRAQRNRATQENYEPGSIFKTIVGLAALEAGLDPKVEYQVMDNPHQHGRGHIVVGNKSWKDTVIPGPYDFKKALSLSSNSYFITNGLRAGIARIIELGQRLHLGETTRLNTHQETAGYFPSVKRISSNWHDGDTANICIGQGLVSVTPLQMAVMTAALANGGKVLWPRVVTRMEPQDPASGAQPIVFPAGRIRDNLGVNPANLKIVQDAMLSEVIEGTGKQAAVPGVSIGGKTGTAQITNERNVIIDHTTWFISFAPVENPRYAVVVMVEGGSSGGGDCAPIAGSIYRFLFHPPKRASSLAQTQPARLN
jgi:penicillin-binding protein 2